MKWSFVLMCCFMFCGIARATETCVGETYNVTYNCGDGANAGALPDADTATYGSVFTPVLLGDGYCSAPSGMVFAGIEVWQNGEYKNAYSTTGADFEFFYASDIEIRPHYVSVADSDVLWRMRGVAGLSYEYNASQMTWKTVMPYGYVSGVARCTDFHQGSTAPGWAAAIIASDYDAVENHSTGGQYCYCKMTEPYIAASPWVFYSAYGSASSCASYCAYYCGNRVRDYAVFRASVFAGAGD